MNPILPHVDINLAAYHRKRDFRVNGCLGFYVATMLCITILVMGILNLTGNSYFSSNKEIGCILLPLGGLGTIIAAKGLYEAHILMQESDNAFKNYIKENFDENECRLDPLPNLPDHYRVWRPGQNAAGQPVVNHLNMLVIPIGEYNRLHVFEDAEAVNAYILGLRAPEA